MKSIEDISELISKHKLGTATEVEEAVLKEWLQDPSNRFKFDAVSSGKAFASKIEFYQRKDGYTKWLQLHTEIQRRKKRKMLAWVAAAVLLPIVATFLLIDWNASDSEVIAPIAKAKEVTLTTGSGITHQLQGVDTTMLLGSSQVEIRSGEISYSETGKTEAIEYNTLEVPMGMNYKLALPDGSTVWLNSNTSLKYPTTFEKDQRKIFLAQGEIFLDVTKDMSKPFVVNMGNENIEVLGTQFNVKHYEEDGEKIITLKEGSISIAGNFLGEENTNTVILSPNQQAVINESNRSLAINEVDASMYTAWLNNIFRYENERLEMILNDLARHYNLRIFYQNQSCKEIEYSLRLNKDKEVEEILQVIELLGGIQFELNKDNLTVKRKM
jgi:ferric-dicitrate binding protein FerR (iron transport regulator)